MTDVLLRPAELTDAPGVAACVCEAYVHYIERIGIQPAPMLENYSEVIRRGQVHVAIRGGRVIGALVLTTTQEGFCLDNVAVRPDVKGTGVGRVLLELAEAEGLRQGFNSIYLFTNELMTENRELYSKIGYIQFDRRVVGAYPRVFFRKALA